MTPSFHSEHGEDRWIFENLKLPQKGVYVDIGCAHPVDSSNTAFLREMGWTGIGIDANPQWAPEWKEGEFVCAVLSDQPTARWRVNPVGHPYASRIDPAAPEVPATNLEMVIQAHSIEKIDLLSINVEGHEFWVLSTLDFFKHRPRIIIAEYDTAGIGKDFRVLEALTRYKGYRDVHKTPSNYIFTRL